MTPGELRQLVRQAPIFKMSLGKKAEYRSEALAEGALIFETDKDFLKAVIDDDKGEIRRTGKQLRSDKYPRANAPDGAIDVWRDTIRTFRNLPQRSLVIHWESDFDYLHWGVSGPEYRQVREVPDGFGRVGVVFHRPLIGSWRKVSVGGVPLSNLHPKARDFAVNMATLNKIQTHDDYFRALFLDENTSAWENLPDWKAKAAGWYAKPQAALLADRRKRAITGQVKEVADDLYAFEADVTRMAATSIHTAAYANGQTIFTTVKVKDIGFTREQLEDEIAALFKVQKFRCALTGYDFKRTSSNPHLKPSLDRKNSSLGYVAGNLQIVTRAANFYKSASDEEDWSLKEKALVWMAAALQHRQREPG